MDGETGDSSPSLPTERDASSTHERALAETSGTGTTPDRGRVIYGRHRRKLYRHPYGMTAACERAGRIGLQCNTDGTKQTVVVGHSLAHHVQQFWNWVNLFDKYLLK